jgi:hypothetical protein
LGSSRSKRFTRGDPLYGVHECAFGVLALDSERSILVVDSREGAGHPPPVPALPASAAAAGIET